VKRSKVKVTATPNMTKNHLFKVASFDENKNSPVDGLPSKTILVNRQFSSS